MSGVLFAAFISYFIGFIGPFAFCGKLSSVFFISMLIPSSQIIQRIKMIANLLFLSIGVLFFFLGIFLRVLIKFKNVNPEEEKKMRHNSSIISFAQPRLRNDQGERFTFVSS